MITLSKIRAEYYGFSGTASSVARNAAFAGIALVWVFRTQGPSSIQLPVELLLPAKSLILALGLDLLHYVISALIWGGYGRYVEVVNPGVADPEVAMPIFINWPALVLFWGKLGMVLFGYWQLFMYANAAITFS